MADKDISSLKRQRTLNKNKLLQIVEFARAIDEQTELEQCIVRLEQVVKLYDTISNIETRIVAMSETEEVDLSIENSYYEAAGRLKTSIRHKQLRESQASNGLNMTANATYIGNHSEVKLPKLYIPPFSGDYTDWPSFFDMFSTTIHDSNLSGVEKFQYLKSLLRGEAASLVRHIRVTEPNYLGAFNKLKERYDNQKYIIGSYIRTFVEQPNANTGHVSSLRKLRDVSDEVIRGLNALGNQAETRDPWIIYLLIQKLDEKTQIAWSDYSSDHNHPTIEDFFKFLDKRILTFETCSAPPKRSLRSNIRGLVSTNEEQSQLNNKNEGSSVNFKCSLCENTSHSLLQCEQFQGMNAIKRKEFIQNSNRCYNCLSSKHPVSHCPSNRRCQQCRRKHHTLLHFGESTTLSNLSSNAEEESSIEPVEAASLACSGPTKSSFTILPTARVAVVNQEGTLTFCRALLDSGSQMSFITEDCVQRLKLSRVNSRVAVSGIGGMNVGSTKGKVTLIIKTKHQRYELNALVLKTIICSLPVYDIPRKVIEKNLILADPEFQLGREIDILIGADHFFSCLEMGQIRLPDAQVVLQKSIFGWIITGQINDSTLAHYSSLLVTENSPALIDIDKTLRRFWEVEEVKSSELQLSEEENLCEETFVTTTKMDEDGRFVVKLPFKQSPTKLGQTLSAAIKRLQGVEKRFSRDPEFKTLYCEFMREYLAMGHMVEVAPNQIPKLSCYLPHHGVLRLGSTTTKLRVVFDGSSKSTTGVSLNQCLAAGPVTQPSLFSIIMRFREYPVVFSADAEKMYRMVRLATPDTDYQRIVWRGDTSEPIKHFRLTTVTYGLTSASYLATRTLKNISEIYGNSYPEASRIIQNSFYVDDLMSGAQTVEEARGIIRNIIELLCKHGFKLRKWKTNCPLALDGIEESLLDTTEKPITERDTVDYAIKVLGICWDPEKDQFGFQCTLDENLQEKFTKRKILSAAGKVFDPMGWLSPVTVVVKIFMQQLWCKKLDWDDPLPEELNTTWLSILSRLNQVKRISLPRHIGTVSASEVDIHGFCDASTKAYAAAVYYRFVTSNNKVIIQLISAKTKVSPINQLSLPRLELCGAVLLTKLINMIKQEAGVKINKTNYWTDSKIVLDWLESHPRRWSTFVGNRTSEIRSSSKREQWRHVPSASNPADCASRGMSPIELEEHDLWLCGPSWLHEEPNMWPVQRKSYDTAEEETNKTFAFITSIENKWLDEFLLLYHSYQRTQRVLCYILRFIEACKEPEAYTRTSKSLTREELSQAEVMLTKHEQIKFYSSELSALKIKGTVPNDSSLKCLSPFVDKYGVLRVGGRLHHSVAPYATKHPIILHCRSRISYLLLQDEHVYGKHAGPSLMMSLIKHKFWIPRGKSKAKSIVDKCVPCYRFNAELQQQLMGSLPKSRVDLVRPFLSTGIDYAGPFGIHLKKGRGQKTYKAYVCIFVCMSIKAIHLELVGDLTSDAFLGALKRFSARRGGCHDLFSDNGTNFVGANAKLNHTFNQLVEKSSNIIDYFSRNQIQWNFNPANSPHFGGLWETGVKSFKFHFKRVMGKNIPTLEEMTTLLAEIEGILNKRPLCRTSGDELDFLTPAHFLHGYSPITIPSLDIVHQISSPTTRWRVINDMVHHFWKRWYNEYLTSLQRRDKWQQAKGSLQVNDVVLVQDVGLPISHWLLGRIIKIHPGSDKRTRVVTLRTTNGEIKRSIHRLCLLPIADQRSSDDCSSETESTTKRSRDSTQLASCQDETNHPVSETLHDTPLVMPTLKSPNDSLIRKSSYD